MPWQPQTGKRLVWRRQRASAWGALLDRQEIMLAALSFQKTGSVRVMVYEHLHAPEGLVHLSERDQWLVQSLRSLGSSLPSPARTMVLALTEGRSRQGVFDWDGPQDMRRLASEVQLEAAQAWGVDPEAVGFDFRLQAGVAADGHAVQQVHWAACLREELRQWQLHARQAGWRLPVVEPDVQAARRAALHLRGDSAQHWAESARDWQFDRTPQRQLSEVDWSWLQGAAVWRPLAACGAALGALV